MWPPSWAYISWILCNGSCNNIHKVTADVLDTLCLISWLGEFFLLTLLCPYLLCGGLLSIWCRGFFGKGCIVCGAWIWLLTLSSAVVGLSGAVTVLSPAFSCHDWSQASALSCMKQTLDKAVLTFW